MSLFKKLVILNTGGVVGVLISFFVVPDNTNFWLWIGTAAAVMISLNFLVLTRRKRKLAAGDGTSRRIIIYLLISFIISGIALAITYGSR